MTTLRFNEDSDAVLHLRAADPVMERLIDAIGVLELHLPDDRFVTLARSIVGQQLSVTAARTIWGRFAERVGTVTPETILVLAEEELRGVGLSRAKVAYVQDLARRVIAGDVDFATLDELTDDEVVAELTLVKGIGRWTAEMFLIFSLGRPDVFALDDVGLQRAIRLAYDEGKDVPSAEDLSLAWRPYRSVASLYLWESLDNKTL